ncbi:MAG: ATP-dependent RecD-like DNA helicase [Deltaproteobacteria bacterium]|nr:ATP-dependent RecD-like DNA helicase [Deltaproteobacteria bacterium]
MTDQFTFLDKRPDHENLLEIEGQIERITYADEESGYTVAKLIVQGYQDLITVVGNIISPSPGETLVVSGTWMDHPKFGRQFKVEDHRIKVPATIQGIKKYLGSGLIKGIGPVMASRIVKKFGEKTLDIIEQRIDELVHVEGIGPKRIDMIREAWQEQKEIRDVMIFLQTHGVGSAYAAKIFKRYGQGSIPLLTQNPYRLATDILGIGFNTADRIAGNLGFAKNSPLRAEAGMLYVLNQLTDEGHVYYPYEPLIEKCQEILGVDRGVMVQAIDTLNQEEKIVIEDLDQDFSEARANAKAVYLTRFYISETGIQHHFRRLIHSPKTIRKIDTDKALQWVQEKIHLHLANKQVEAVKKAISDKVMVITGGPGTGKTTIINAVIRIYSELGVRIQLAAPTGRATKRMSEATGHPAKTIHRMLEYSRQTGGFQRDQDHPLDVDVLILDEVSMIDTILMYHLLKAIPSYATLILVGDENQLPSVGAGSILKDILQSGVVAVVELNEIFRQAQKSKIIVNAHLINQGLIPEFIQDRNNLEDFYFIEQDDPVQVIQIILELVSIRIPKRFHLDPIDEIQVLSPMHKGIVGTGNLNIRLQEILNPSETKLIRGERAFRLNDKVMQIRNNYDKEVFNGDMGRITSIDPENQTITIVFDGMPVIYDYSELDEVVQAYAISVHKSQGSEYPAVIIPVLSQHYILLQRNLIYTAVTRGKALVVLVGSKKALAMGIKNNKVMQRYTYLAQRLRSE